LGAAYQDHDAAVTAEIVSGFIGGIISGFAGVLLWLLTDKD
jgi:hypothetical protein